MLTTDEAWSRALATWSAESQAHLRTETIDVFFSISFRNEAGLRDRTTVLRAIQKFLLENRGYSGLRAGERIRDERTGVTHDYSGRQDIAYKEVVLPSDLAGRVDMSWTRAFHLGTP